ncbi:MAG: serine/threonine protein kinase [Micromonosporaceae bacterium]
MAWLAGLGTRFAVFDQQDSGCVSYGVDPSDGRRLFVKASTTPSAVESLRRALRLHAAVHHPAMVAPIAAHELDDGQLVLVYPWRDGRLLRPTTASGSAVRTDPDGAMVAFRSLPVPRVQVALDAILDAHEAVTRAGFVAVDLYDGCFLYDFDAHRMQLIDLDEYRPGPFTVDADRLPGSSRYMAPEEWRRGATIDERTTVHGLGRTLRLLLDAGDEENAWRGNPTQLAVVHRATAAEPDDRFPTVAALRRAWREAG